MTNTKKFTDIYKNEEIYKLSSRVWERFPSGKTGVFKAKCVVTHPHLIKGEIFLFFPSLPPPDQHRTNRAITEGYDPCPNSCEMEQLTSPLHSHRTTPTATTPPTRRQPSRTENKIGMHQLPECNSYMHLSFGGTCSPQPPFIFETGTIWYI